MSDIRVRIAPSPSANTLNLGNVRTALFNFLFARKNNGKFIFRIEDSDSIRSKPEYADGIAETLSWLGLNPDEGYKIGGELGPYSQSEKSKRYSEVVNILLNKGLAYKCYCTQEELDKIRNDLPEKDRHKFRYPGLCRDKSDHPNKDFVVRYKSTTEGSIEWNDLVFGKIKIPNVENFDWVLMRSNGEVLYNVACAVDDIDHKITHIIRGKDHIQNTANQICIYNALNVSLPAIAHLPMMVGQDNIKLTKRNAAVAISAYREAGYTPGAILNYLARFGWASGNKEIFSLKELIDLFTIEACGKNDGKFDPKKFAAIQFEHLKNPTLVSDEEYINRLIPFLHARGIVEVDYDKIVAALPLIRPRAHTLVEAAEEIIPFVIDDIKSDPGNLNQSVSNAVKTKISSLLLELEHSEIWNENTLRQLTKDWLVKENLSLKELGGFMRLSLTGRPHSPELFQVMAALGRQKSIKRLQIGAAGLAQLDN